jgi:methylmalonyl-CoA mutase N-terminal domain/subunit
VVVGVNRFADGAAAATPQLHRTDPALEAAQAAGLARLRAARDAATVAAALAAVGRAARGTANLLPPILEAVKARATLGEIADTMRATFGEYRKS